MSVGSRVYDPLGFLAAVKLTRILLFPTLKPITPNHLLLGRANLNLTPDVEICAGYPNPFLVQVDT